MAKKKYELTDEHRAQLKPWAEKWIANNLSTKQMDDEDRAAMRTAMAGMYAAANLEPVPEHRQVFCAGPVTGAIAASIASGVWWLRESPKGCEKLFGRSLSETEMMAALRDACTFSVRAAFGLPVPKIDATDAATDAATRAATDAATYEATRAATRAATSAATDAVTSFLMRCCSYWWRFCNSGNAYSAWTAYLSFFHRVAKLDLPIYDKWTHYESAPIHGGFRFMHRRFWIICDRPMTIGRDEQNRPHCDNGPQLSWRDGFSTHYIHGVKVPAFVVERPAEITVAAIDAETNVEVRRVMISRYVGGVAAYIRDAGAQVIDEVGEGIDRLVLRRRDRKGDTPIVTLTMVNHTTEADGTVKEYTIRVPSTMTSAREAMAWSHSRRVDQYAPQFQS